MLPSSPVRVRSLTRRDGSRAPPLVSHASESQVSARAAYVALRVCPRADADVWWSAVRRRDDIPYAIAALLGGRARIELTREEATHTLV